MSKTIKVTVSDEDFADLTARAGSQPIPDYVRSVLFPGRNVITPLDAVNRALATCTSGQTFSLPELYGDDWNLPNGVAGQFGRKFNRFVEENYQTRIRFTGNFNAKQHAVYEVV